MVETDIFPQGGVCRAPVDLLFLVDSSGSLGVKNFNRQKNFVKRVISKFTISKEETQVSVVTFSNKIKRAFCFNAYYNIEAMKAAIDKIPYTKGGTQTGKALKYAKDQSFKKKCGFRPDSAKVVIVLTDGKSTNPEQTKTHAKNLKKTGVKIISIGVGQGVTMEELKVIASNNNLVFKPRDFNELDQKLDKITSTTCITAQSKPGHEELCTGVCSSNLKCMMEEEVMKCLCEDGFMWAQDVDGCVPLPGYMEVCTKACTANLKCKTFGEVKKCMCQPGFSYDTEIHACVKIKQNHGKIDILFAIDITAGFSKGDYNMLLNFLVHIGRGFYWGKHNAQFGMVLFSTTVVKVYTFTVWKNPGQLLAELKPLTFKPTGGQVDFSVVFQHAWQTAFTVQNGARPDAAKLVILITTGQTTNEEGAVSQVQTMQSLGIHLTIVGIGGGVSKPQLTSLVISVEWLYLIPGYSELVTCYGWIITICVYICKLPAYNQLCADHCASNYQCLESAGEFRCICKKGNVYDTNKYACVPLPGFREKCTAVCSANLQCVKAQGGKKCLCPLGFVYNKKTKHCTLDKMCGRPVDLFFLIDASDHVGDANFAKELDFVTSVAQGFDVDKGTAKIAAMTYGSQDKKLFCFNTHSTKGKVINALKGATYTKGAATLDYGLHYARTNIFTTECGVRPDAGKVAVVFSAGTSSEPELTSEEAKKLKKTGVQVIAVGLGNKLHRNELWDVASTKGQVWFSKWELVRSIYKAVLTGACEAAEISLKVPGYTEYCFGKCASNLECVKTEGGASICTCKPNWYWEVTTQKCMKTPGHNQVCISKCAHNLQCLVSGGGNKCLCPEGHYFSTTSNLCVPDIGYQEECTTKDKCAASLKCLKLSGKSKCLCPKGTHWDPKEKLCASIPGFGEVCTGICANHLECNDFGSGTLMCGCPVGYYWVVEKDKCFKIPGYLEPCTDMCATPLHCITGVCKCKDGFYYDTTDTKCKKIPTHLQECLGVCESNLKCTSKGGDKNKCHCPSGFNWDAGKKECLLMEKCKAPVDIMFAIDASGSLGEKNFKKEIAFAKEIAQNFPIGPSDAQIGALTFSGKVNVIFEVADLKDTNAVLQKLDTAKNTNGVTRTDLALNHVRVTSFDEEAGARKGAVKLLVVITDGKSTKPEKTVKEAMTLKATGVTVVSVGVGSGISMDELKVIATDTSMVFKAKNFDALDTIKAEVTAQACEAAKADPGYGETCTDKCASNYHCLEEKGEKKCLCPGGFYFDGTILACVKLPGHNEACVGRCSAQLLCDAKTSTCQCQGDLEYDTATKTCLLREPCRAPLDLLFVVDSSGSLGQDNFNKELAFVEKIINSFDVNPQGAQVAMLTFSTSVKKQFCFNEHTTKESVNQAVKNVPYPRGVTMTHLALESAMNDYYISTCGARPNAAKVTVVVTDGMSTYPESTKAAAPALHATGVKVVSIGIGSGVSQDELKIIASSGDLVFSANNFDVLDAIEKEVSATACEAATSLPGYLEGCAGSCSSNLLCMAKNGEDVCDCEDYFYWDENVMSCVALKCLSGQNVCADKPNGDFPACAPECNSGFFYNCFNGHTELGQCVFGHLEIALHPGQSSTDIPGLTSSERCSKLEALCPP